MKRILILLAVASFSSIAFAQNTMDYEEDRYQVMTNKFSDNWFFSFGGGGEMLLGNSDVHADFKDRIAPTFNAALGKWFTPGLGLRLQYSGFQARGLTRNGNNDYVDGGRQDNGFYKQKFKYMNLHGDILFNLSAMLGGYNEHRVYEFIPYLGAGFTNNFDKPRARAFALNGGIINRFRLSSAWDFNLELSIMGTGNKFDGELGGTRDADGVVAATIGFTYKFPKRGFDKYKTKPQLISEAELNNLRNRMNELAADNQHLRSELANATRPVTPPVVQPAPAPNMAPRSIFFRIGSSKLNANELVNIGHIAEQMKAYPNSKFTVRGFADSATGTARINQRLSEERAKVVVEELVKHGIDRSRFTTIEGMGGVAKFEKPFLNRMALIEMVR